MTVPDRHRFSDHRPRLLAWLAALVAFLTIFDWFVMLDVPFLRNPSAITALLLIALYLVKRGLRYTVSKRDWPQIFLLLFLFYTLSIELARELLAGHGNLSGMFTWYAQYIQVGVLFLLVSDIARDPRHLGMIWTGVIAGLAFMALAVMLSLPGFTEEVEEFQRQGFTGINLNRQSYYYALGVITLTWVLIERKLKLDFRTVVFVGLLALLLLPFVWTGSRGAIIALVAGLAVLFSVSLRKANVSAYLAYVPLIAGGLTLLIMQSELILGRFEQALQGEQLGLRDEIFAISMNLIVERPGFGFGQDHIREIGQALGYGGGYSPHNVFFQVVLSFGVIGLALWLLFLGSITLKLLAKRRNPTAALFLALLACSLVYGLTGGIAHDKFFWFVLGLSVFAWRADGIGWLEGLGYRRFSAPVRRSVEFESN